MMEKKKQPDNTDPKLILKYLNQQITNNKLSINEPLEYQEFIDRCKIKITQNNEDGIYIIVTTLWSISIYIEFPSKPCLILNIIPTIACNNPITYVWLPGSIFLTRLKYYPYNLDIEIAETIKKLLNLHISDDGSILSLPDKIEIDD